MIQAEDGREITSHEQKASVLWNSFKGRLGQSVECQMMFDLSTMITPQDLSSIEEPFTREEIDSIVKHMPNDKSAGPDGFNGLFMKRFWYLIKPQFYELCNAFYNGNLDIQSLNTVFIALIPKINTPSAASDYRPISRVIMAMKILTKLLANRLQDRIIPLLHKNQYGFI
jgi:hypothetical protein